MNAPITIWEPTLDRVGALLRTRTKDVNGNYLGTFTAATRPTDVEAQELIDQATTDLVSVVGDTLPDEATEQATGVAALGGACLIELSFFPEQINTGRSPYLQLKELYDDRLKVLVKLVQVNGGSTPNEPGVPMAPVASFPQPCPYPGSRYGYGGYGYDGVPVGYGYDVLPIGFRTRW